ncbi:Transmembrane protease serine 11D [Papilio machaon]|uniref:Transmembrane protease serine 11D n=1 Tax=Papilio machaon TaxID=76193 RepID=A0A0N1INX2_PAPMA|nr:Transmembrane protease serine 11D [Papilio machaon]
MREASMDGKAPVARGRREKARVARWALAVSLLVLICPASARSLVADDENLSPMGNEYKPCFRERDRRVGVCVHFTQCYKNQSLAYGGNIFKYDVRPGGDVNRGHRTESGLYCGGALVSPRAVLTSAGCVTTVAQESVWARVPASAAPSRNYAVTDKLRHEGYNSGNSKNDFGLMILKDSVEFATSPFSACVSFSPPPAAGCRAVGFGVHEQVVLTPMSLRDGDCPPRNRSIPDLVCAMPAVPAPCDVSPGAPVLCPTGDAQGGLALAGVVRRQCRTGAAHLGNLQPHADWLQLQLRRLGVPAWQYAL